MTPALAVLLGAATIALYGACLFSQGIVRAAFATAAIAFPLVSGLALFKPWGRHEAVPAEGRAHFHGRGRFMALLAGAYWFVGSSFVALMVMLPNSRFDEMTDGARALTAGLVGAIAAFSVAVGWSLRRTDVIVDDVGVSVFTRGEADWSRAWSQVAKVHAYYAYMIGPKGAPIQYQVVEVTDRSGATCGVDGKRLPDKVMERLKGTLREQASRRRGVEWVIQE